jgi:hypothetical protein
MRRPSPATAISVAALVIALSGTGYAATGGTFLLGRANKASAVSSLSNSNGTALRLSSKAGTPPLTVGNSVLVRRLNASELAGIPASGFMQGTGSADSGSVAITGNGSGLITSGPESSITGICDANDTTGGYLVVGLDAGDPGTIVWWNKDGTSNSGDGTAQVTPESQLDYVVVVQVMQGSIVTTYTASQTYNPGTGTCAFTAQVITTG